MPSCNRFCTRIRYARCTNVGCVDGESSVVAGSAYVYLSFGGLCFAWISSAGLLLDVSGESSTTAAADEQW